MKRKFLMVLLISGILLLGIFPIQTVLSVPFTNVPSANVNSALDFIPTMNIPPNVDTNHNGIVDSLDQEIATRSVIGLFQEYIDVIVMLKTQPTASDTNVFVLNGGYLTTIPWTYALYGFGGRMPYNEITAFVEQCPDVLLIEKGAIVSGSLAYATKQVGARTYVWNTLGLQGDPNSAIAILDTGIDGSHPDFAPGYGDQNFSKKIVGWNDQVTSTASPVDDNGHGSHTSGLAAGDGFFSVDSTGKATATWSATLVGISSGTYLITGMMVNKTGNITLNVKWTSTGTARLAAIPLYYGDKTVTTSLWSQVASVNTNNPDTWYNLTYTVPSTPTGGYDMYHPEVNVTSGTGNLYVAFNMSWPYTPPADGFSAWTGMAPQSKLVGVKVLDNAGSGTSAQFISGINWVIANRMAYHITVASMSVGSTSEQSSIDSAVVNLVNSGVATIVSAGNSGSGGNFIYTPASVDEVTTVAAMNQFDSIASYSSQGGTSHSTGNTVKPDITAPGGSFYGVPLFSADSNTNDAQGGFTEFQANDSAPMLGTSMAAPIVAGAEQIIVQAMGGYNAWNYTRSQALMPKTILLMTATETYPNLRESTTSASSPTLNRGGKDAQEGYGRLNLDAGADAVLKTYQIGNTASDALGKPPTQSDISVLGQRLAWARNTRLISGVKYNFTLTVPSGADYDLYLYNITGNTYGEPVIVASSTTATLGGFENITYTPSVSGTYYIVVKLAREDSPGGQFTLKSQPISSSYLVVRGQNNAIWYRTYNATTLSWTPWNGLPGVTIDSPAAAYADNTLHIVVRGVNNDQIWYSNINLTDNTFSGWMQLSGATPSAPTLTGNSTTLCLVVRGENNIIYYRFYTIASQTWTGWNALPSGTTPDAPAASLVGNTLHIAVRGSDGTTLWYSNVDSTTQAFSGWTLLDGSTPSTPTLTSNGTALTLIVRGQNNQIYYRTDTINTQTWTPWNALPSGTTPDSPAATIIGNTLYTVVRGSDGSSLWQSSIDLATSTFVGWTPLSGSTPSKPTLTS